MKKAPKFSIIMPTYNRAFCICNAINSLLTQTYPGFELIIVDDGSIDNTKALIYLKYASQISTRKIKYVKTYHGGVCKARNVGLATATNEWIGYLDTDNIMSKNFLGVMSNAILNSTAYAFYGQMYIPEINQTIGHEFNLQSLLRKNYIDMGTYVHHKNLYLKYGGFDERMTRLVDWDLITRYSMHEVPQFINHIVLTYNSTHNYDRISTTEDYNYNYNLFIGKYI